uniref:F-box domain-containing protein n=1 Tax=Mycena chlorophos TaxID=658473 RepID=A0ABQ0M2C2_MYCCL|nr:predicted protein [Mycena chlorophos]
MSTFASLPPELLDGILLHLDFGSLVSLCQTARLFIDPAQYILYANIRLPSESLNSWCSAVRNRRHLAERTNSLHLILPHSAEPPEEVHDALRACVNLTELRISCEGPRASGQAGPNACAHEHSIPILEDCQFHLTKFENAFLSSFTAARFLATQPGLRIFASPHPFTVLQAPETLHLPRLVGLGAPAKSIPPHLPLQRIQLRLSTSVGPDLLLWSGSLANFSHTLTTLEIISTSPRHYSFTALLRHIAAVVPTLEHIALADPPEHHELQRGYMIEAPTDLIFLFPRLKTFTLILRAVLDLRSYLDPAEATDANWYQRTLRRIYSVYEEKELRELALDTMVAGHSSSLWRVAIGAQAVPDAEQLCIVTREIEGGLEVQLDDKIHFDSLSPFWN